MAGDYNRSVIITYTSLFIALTAVFSWISIPFFPVPLTLQTLAVLLTGTIMKRYAGLVMILYIFLGLLGLPVFHNGTAGIGILIGPTGGYMIGFILAATFLGFLYERRSDGVRIAGLIIAAFLIDLCGVTWLIISVPLNPVAAIITGMVPFIAGDVVKAIAAFFITKRFEPYLGDIKN
jgi:biotin transport system substrate-specific component